MTEPADPPVADERVEPPVDQSWLEMENLRGGVPLIQPEPDGGRDNG